jgi:hypothetical protein
MPKEQQCEQSKDKMKRDEREALENLREKLDNLIREQVIQALGKPTDLRNVQVRKVWQGHYRVNVIVGENGGSVRVANSYFVVIDSEGSLITATPTITKQY